MYYKRSACVRMIFDLMANALAGITSLSVSVLTRERIFHGRHIGDLSASLCDTQADKEDAREIAV